MSDTKDTSKRSVGRVEIRCPEVGGAGATVLVDGLEVQRCRKVTVVVEAGEANAVILELIPETIGVDVVAVVQEDQAQKASEESTTDNSG